VDQPVAATDAADRRLLLYFRAFFGLLAGSSAVLPSLLIGCGQAGAAFGIANEKRWGYSLGVRLVLRTRRPAGAGVGPGALLRENPITLLFEVAPHRAPAPPPEPRLPAIWFS
jgi:hypothetical protein